KDEAGAKRDVALPPQIDRLARAIIAGCELAQLVELAIGGQISLGHHSQQLAPGGHRSTVIQQALKLQKNAPRRYQRHPPPSDTPREASTTRCNAAVEASSRAC